MRPRRYAVAGLSIANEVCRFAFSPDEALLIWLLKERRILDQIEEVFGTSYAPAVAWRGAHARGEVVIPLANWLVATQEADHG